MIRAFGLAIALATAPLALSGCASFGPEELAQVKAGELGATRETAIKVSSVAKEYKIVRSLGLELVSQALAVHDRKAYDILTVSDPRSGKTRKLWFDISSFYGSGMI